MLDITKQRLTTLAKLGFVPKNILDIGAFQGAWSQMAREVWPEAEYYLVEPNQKCQPFLERKNFEQVAYQLLGKRQGEKVKYYRSRKEIETGNSIYPEQTWYFEDAEVVEMEVETLAHMVGQRKWPVFDLIKLDTQGSEVDIMQGGEAIIKAAEFVLVETQILEYNLGAPMMGEVLGYMDQIGFRPYDITEIHHLVSDEMFQMDWLLVRKDSSFVKKGILWQRN